MAFASTSTSGGTSDKTAGTSITGSALNVARSAGDLVVVLVALNNTQTTDGQTSEVTSVTDTKSNTYTKAGEYCNGQGGAASGATVSAWFSVLTTGLTTSDTITANFANSIAASAMTWRGYTIGAGNGVQLVAGSLQVRADDGADTGSLTIGSLTSKEYLFVRATANEAEDASGWTLTNYTPFIGANTAGGSGATNMTIRGGHRILTGTGDTTDPTLATTGDNASVFFALEETTPVVRLAPQPYLIKRAVRRASIF